MKKLALLAALAIPLSGCAGFGIPDGPPTTIADSTIVDEQARIGAGLLYVTASRLGNALCPSGSSCRPQFQALDRTAYGALERLRAAYAAGNATSYAQAYEELRRAVTGINSLGGQP